MNSIRKERVSELIRRKIAPIIINDISFLYPDAVGLVSIENIIMSNDLRIAKVYISIFSDDQKANDIISMISKEESKIRFILAKELYLKYMPEIRIYRA